LELFRHARKWKLHSKENCKHIKHFLEKQRFFPITSVKGGLKPLLFPSCKSRRTVSCTTKQRSSDVLGSKEMGAVGGSMAASEMPHLCASQTQLGHGLKQQSPCWKRKQLPLQFLATHDVQRAGHVPVFEKHGIFLTGSFRRAQGWGVLGWSILQTKQSVSKQSSLRNKAGACQGPRALTEDIGEVWAIRSDFSLVCLYLSAVPSS